MSNKLTLKSCIEYAQELDIPVYGDVDYRGDCPVEDSDLASFFAWVRYQYPQCSPLIFHPENEFNPTGSGSYSYHVKSVAKGRLDGVADIICLSVAKGAPSFACELKRKNISKSIASKKRKEHFLKQCDRLHIQQASGSVVCIALGLEAAKQAFIDYLERYA